MEVGKSYWVYVFLDLLSNRVAATTKFQKYLDNTPPDYKPGQEVDLIVFDETELGYNAHCKSRTLRNVVQKTKYFVS